MAYLFTVFGLMIAVTVFLYLVYAADTGKRKFNELRTSVSVPAGRHTSGPQTQNRAQANGAKPAAIRQITTHSKANLLDDKLKDMLPQRTCPLCQSELRRDEPLYAHNMEYGGKRTILIYGCPYCYKDEKKSKRVSG